MAEEKEDQDNNEEEASEAKKKIDPGKIKLIALIVVVLLLIGSSIGGTLYLLGVFDGGDEVAEVVEGDASDGEEGQAEPAKASAMYFPIKPAFVVNFSSRGRQRFLQTEITVLTRQDTVFDALQLHLPLVKNQLVMLFSGEVYEDLQTDEGRELLRQKALEVLQGTITQETGIENGVEEVLFTNFVMQ
jgi:flagellar FliL protein